MEELRELGELGELGDIIQEETLMCEHLEQQSSIQHVGKSELFVSTLKGEWRLRRTDCFPERIQHQSESESF